MPPRSPLVDALRAIAALAVLGTHTAFFAGAYAPGTAVGPYAQRLDSGVTIFFLISGFLLYRPWVAARHSGRPRPRTGAYFWRRLLRIGPAYWVALLAALLLVEAAGGWSWNATPALFGFGQGYRSGTVGLGLVQGWSLGVEVAFYAFLPVWGFALRKLGGGFGTEWLALAGLAAAGLLYKIVVVSTTGTPEQVVTGPWLLTIPGFLDQFAVGMGLAVASVQLGDRALPAWMHRGAGVSWLLAGVVFWVVSTQIGIGKVAFEAWTPAQFLVRHELYLLMALLLVWPAVLGSGGRLRSALASPVLAWLGMVSYGIFLWNTTVLDQLARVGFEPFAGIHPYVAWLLVALPITVLFAAGSWYLIERPMQRYSHRGLGRRTVREPGPTTVRTTPV